jgi:hypothetical protein
LLGPIGIVVAGPLAAWLGARHALLVVAASVVVPTALALLAPGVRTMRMPAETPAAESAGDVAQPSEPVTVVAPVSVATSAESVAQA